MGADPSRNGSNVTHTVCTLSTGAALQDKAARSPSDFMNGLATPQMLSIPEFGSRFAADLQHWPLVCEVDDAGSALSSPCG